MAKAKRKVTKTRKRRPSAARTTVVERLKKKLASAKKRITTLSQEVDSLKHPSPRKTAAWVIQLLTPRQWQVLRLFVDHPNDKEIARMLKITPATVRTHLVSIERKLGVDSRNEILNYAHAHGPLPPSLGELPGEGLPT
ncbi:MAG: response regulator transcription factor [Pirellulaceae bacterium]|nr:response regulator transcription factor [Pirellulaceae bacterium]